MKKFFVIVISIVLLLAVLTGVAVLESNILKKAKKTDTETTKAPEAVQADPDLVKEKDEQPMTISINSYEKPIPMPEVYDPKPVDEIIDDQVIAEVDLEKVVDKLDLCEFLQGQLDNYLDTKETVYAMQYFLNTEFKGTDDIRISDYPTGFYATDAYAKCFSVEGKPYLCCVTFDMKTAYLMTHYSQENSDDTNE